MDFIHYVEDEAKRVALLVTVEEQHALHAIAAGADPKALEAKIESKIDEVIDAKLKELDAAIEARIASLDALLKPQDTAANSNAQ